MKTTPHLSLEYGGFTYDGGNEKAPDRNLDKIEDELNRLYALAGIVPDFRFVRGPFTWDGGQEVAAKSNLVAIAGAINSLWTSQSVERTVTLNTRIGATDGGSPHTMAENLLVIDGELEELAEILDGEGGGDAELPENPGTGDWLTGTGSILMTVGVETRPVDDETDPTFTFRAGFELGYWEDPISPLFGSATNGNIGDAHLVAAKVTHHNEDDHRSGLITLTISFMTVIADEGGGDVEPLEAMGDRNVRLFHNGDLFWQGALDGTYEPLPEVNVGPGTVVMVLNDLPDWEEGDTLVLDIDAP